MATQGIGAGGSLTIPPNYLRHGVINRKLMYEHLVENGLLREDQTREIDETLVRVARRDLVAVADLRGAGLTKSLNNIGITSYEYERVTPVGEATQSMSITNLGDRDLVNFGMTAIPVPVTASQFRMDARMVAAGGGSGAGVNLVNIEEHTRSVAEKLEDTLVNGSEVVLGSNLLYGYTDFPAREQLSYTNTEWNDPSADAQDAIRDVIAMRDALRANGFSGPYVLYLPTDYDGVIDEDYKEFGDRTLRERILQINGISAIRTLPSLAPSNVLLVQMTSSVVQAVIGQDITTVTWDTYGGLASHWAILAVMSFALKSAWARAPLSNGVLPPLTTAAGIAHLA